MYTETQYTKLCTTMNAIGLVYLQLQCVFTEWDSSIQVVASFPGHSQILSHSCGKKPEFSPQL